MALHAIDEDVLALVSELAKPEPFESLSSALRRVLTVMKEGMQGKAHPESLATERTFGEGRTREPMKLSEGHLAMLNDLAKRIGCEELFNAGNVEQGIASQEPNLKRTKERLRAPSPDPQSWASRIPDLRSVPRLTSWQAICEHLSIEVAGDSARRK